MENTKYYEFFCGQKISEYGLQNGYVDYHALAASFNHVRCNDIINLPDFWDVAEMESGEIDNSEAIEELEEEIAEIEDAMSEIDDENCEEYVELEEKLAQAEHKINDLKAEEGDLPDVFQVTTAQLKQCIELGLIADLTDVFEKYASDGLKESEHAYELGFQSGFSDGKLYGISTQYFGDAATMNNIFSILIFLPIITINSNKRLIRFVNYIFYHK